MDLLKNVIIRQLDSPINTSELSKVYNEVQAPAKCLHGLGKDREKSDLHLSQIVREKKIMGVSGESWNHAKILK